MSQEEKNRQLGGAPASGDGRDGQSQFDAGRRQFGDNARRHVEAGHGEQRTYSPRGIASDGTYVGHAGGYVGGRPIVRDHDTQGGEGTYGYPYGQGIGLVGGRHPDDEAKLLGPQTMPEDRGPDPGDRFGAGRAAEWRSPSFDPGFRDAEYMEFRNAHGRHLDRDYRDYSRELGRGRTFTEMFEEWLARRRRATEATQTPPRRSEDSGF
jgi:hypothetical protein